MTQKYTPKLNDTPPSESTNSAQLTHLNSMASPISLIKPRAAADATAATGRPHKAIAARGEKRRQRNHTSSEGINVEMEPRQMQTHTEMLPNTAHKHAFLQQS